MTLSRNPLPTVDELGAPASLRYSSSLSSILLDKTVSFPGTDCLIKSNVPLSTLTSFQVGGPAEWYVAPQTVQELQMSLAWAVEREIPITLLGAGSNLLISDRGLPGLVVGTRYLKQMIFDEETGQLTVGAGTMLPLLAQRVAKRGWRGLEWAVGIPGTVGGSVVMNAGAHGGCISDILVEVQVLNMDGTCEVLTADQLAYRYRTSNLQGGGRLVTQATFQMQPGFDPIEVRRDTDYHLNQRHSTQPYDRPSCGSVFRNPGEYKAGWLIEQAGLKGYQIGGAKVAERHANFILNCGEATATDIFRLIHHVQRRVEQQWSLHLEPEVRILGDFQAA
ncbi:UDP-N-acetylmuramate dehydrogenase [Alkalinema sp. FACHB-956]|uniref:UDP-N-acetylmuramate dehydrogenase n=1 Tax=Alkalinema sp. FACHB-956 TaxID=2692768 RepID=UPI001683E036|nr:UDP-N-acetylmuramate dehydrogenase [Alkalinema sp. FACHB-956]MBD2326380.1 UDP-N-acetylmuramate dehydrogenase [Alkalinema sp. FACHB-956]